LFEGVDRVTGSCVGVCKNGDLSPDCHYGGPVGYGWAQQFITNLQVLGSYPGKDAAKLTDNDMDTEWWTEALTADRKTGTGAFISFTVPSDLVVNCVRLVMPCTKEQPTSFTIHRGKAEVIGALTPAFYTTGLPFASTPSRGWLGVSTSRRDGSVVDLGIPCGILDAQFFGELFMSYTEVGTACGCAQLCLDHIDEGCVTWKWYQETQHCFLQTDVFRGTTRHPSALPAKPS
jgi:hypothetical protein